MPGAALGQWAVDGRGSACAGAAVPVPATRSGTRDGDDHRGAAVGNGGRRGQGIGPRRGGDGIVYAGTRGRKLAGPARRCAGRTGKGLSWPWRTGRRIVRSLPGRCTCGRNIPPRRDGTFRSADRVRAAHRLRRGSHRAGRRRAGRAFERGTPKPCRADIAQAGTPGARQRLPFPRLRAHALRRRPSCRALVLGR